MAEVLSSRSVLPWIWSIETLASNNEVDASLIHDIIEMAPPLPDDLGENMIEVVTLRCLEGLYGYNDGSVNKASLAMDSKIRFHPSESCESVLHFIFGKTPSNLRLIGAEHLKLDIHSFIMHKRDSMARCTLQQLKDSILEGTNKYVATLKGISGLTCVHERAAIPSDDGDCNVLPQMCTVSQSNGEKGNSVSQTLEDEYKLSEKVPLNSSLSNRDKFELGSEKVVGDTPGSQYVLKAKKRKRRDSSAITSEDEPCRNLSGSEIEKNSTCPAEPQILSVAPQEGTHHEIHESSGTQKHSFQPRTPNNRSHDESPENVITNEPKDNMDDYCEAEKSPGCDGYGNEKIDVVMMKNPFLSSHFTLGHGSSATADWTERNLCVKCNEGGQLLVCNTHGCYMVIHEGCLGISAKFDNKGKFFCPFCTYSVAISEYLEAKKKTSLARKRLAAFIGPNFERRSNGLAEGSHMKEGGPRQGEDEDLEVLNGHLGEAEGNQASDTGDRMHEINSNQVQQCVDGKQRSEPLVSRANDQGFPGVRGTGDEDHVPPADNRIVTTL